MSAAQQTPAVWHSPGKGRLFALPGSPPLVETTAEYLPADAVPLVPVNTVPAPRTSRPRVWSEDDFAQLERDDPPSQKLPDTDLMCGRVRTWKWRVREDLMVTRSWREGAERGRWVEGKA